MITRAKFECSNIDERDGGNDITLRPVVSGSEENENFFRYTPWGEINIGIVNENVQFEVGKSYYVDFTEVIVDKT